ncbi:MAG: A/G-specific adenine glycosylase, partial [Spirochaetales bacterium]|nr:A/G-specific adenine glycosylase [Spirochaetales bacterium]
MPTAKGVAPTVTLDDALAFQSVVLEFYRLNGRDFQWRRTRDPWSILVSEVMLQQTQTHRVAPKFESWMKRFPDAESLANASVAEVYDAWRGLGYNSRALRLRESAAACVRDYGGQPPADERSLIGLPGVGRYTARAVLAFAFNIPGIVIETNIRTALIL